MQSLTLDNGRPIPQLGYGVYTMTSEEVARCLPEAIAMGYTHIDTANAYFNEVAVGRAIKASGASREDLFVTTKLFPQSYPYAQCGPDIDASLERLGMDYVDLMLFHQPYGDYVAGWRAMEEAVEAGKVRAIGLSNFPPPQGRPDPRGRAHQACRHTGRDQPLLEPARAQGRPRRARARRRHL